MSSKSGGFFPSYGVVVSLLVASFAYRVPAKDWKSEGWTAPEKSESAKV
ncbi:MAG: hypothetical protein NZ738_02465 [Oceanospirillaceae bacterium]|jgi:hypothetical protein|nr:hypothetical protein [Oceanospirillaceae bacterium]